MKELLLKRKKQFALYLFAAIILSFENLTHTISFSLMIGAVEVGEMSYFIKTIFASVALLLFGALIFVVSRFMRIRYMRDTILDVRIQAFRKIINHSYEHFSKRSKEVYISNMINDINTFEKSFFLMLLNIIFGIGVYIISLSIALWLDYKFAIGVFIASGIMFFITKSFEKKTVALQEEVSENNEKFVLDVSNTLNGLEILKLNSVEKKFLYKTLKAVDQVERKKFHYTVFTEGQRSMTSLLASFIFVGMLIYLMELGFAGVSFTTIAYLFQVGNGCIWTISQVIPRVNELKASVTIYNKITGKDDETEMLPLREAAYNFEKVIDVKDLKFNYEGKEIFKGTSFTLEKGKKYLLKGPSGSGKSTLIKLLSMIYDQYDGSITMDGIDYRQINEEQFNEKVAFIYQDVFLFEDTIWNNITLYKDIPQEQVQRAVELAGMKDFISERELGLEEHLLENGKNLSGGQRQRISIARAIVKNAQILFVDECTSGLNEELGRAVEDTLLSLDSTILSISHRYYEGVTEKYDYVLELKNGMIHVYTGEEYFGEEVAI